MNALCGDQINRMNRMKMDRKNRMTAVHSPGPANPDVGSSAHTTAGDCPTSSHASDRRFFSPPLCRDAQFF